NDLAERHRNAARNLRKIFAEAGLQDELLQLAEIAFARKVAGPVERFAHRFDIGCKPGETMRRILIGVHERGADPALLVSGDIRDRHDRLLLESFGRRKRLFTKTVEPVEK